MLPPGDASIHGQQIYEEKCNVMTKLKLNLCCCVHTGQKERSMSCSGQEKQEDDGEQQTVRRRELQTRHRVTLTGLFKALKNMVCPSIQSTHNCEASSNQRSPAKVRKTVRTG